MVTPRQDTPASPLPELGIVSARLLAPAWLLVLAGLQIADGTTDALPIWLRGIALRSGLSPELLLRILLGSEFLLAGLMLLLGRWSRPVAIMSLAGVCFSAIASVAAAPGARFGVLVNLLVATLSALLLLAVLRSPEARRGRTDGPALSPQLRALGALAVAVIAAGVAGRVPIRAVEPGVPARAGRLVAVELDFRNWIGRRIAELPLREHLPELTALTLEGTRVVVFYNVRCGTCHDLFRDHVVGRLPVGVIAVDVPPESGAVLLPSDQPASIHCPECTFLELPAGPVWLLTPPVVVVVEDGVIRCVDDHGSTDCLDRLARGEPVQLPDGAASAETGSRAETALAPSGAPVPEPGPAPR